MAKRKCSISLFGSRIHTSELTMMVILLMCHRCHVLDMEATCHRRNSTYGTSFTRCNDGWKQHACVFWQVHIGRDFFVLQECQEVCMRFLTLQRTISVCRVDSRWWNQQCFHSGHHHQHMADIVHAQQPSTDIHQTGGLARIQTAAHSTHSQ